MTWEEYAKKLDGYGAAKDGEARALVRQAFDFASEAHLDQTRFSGEPYITHPLAVSLKIAALQLDATTIAAALLHDTVEDERSSLKAIRKKFGDEVAFLVDGLTKVKKIRYRGVERQVESMRKMFLALAEDIRVVIIKLMDRLHNMETLASHPKPEKQQRIALETLEIYVPLADRLGMWSVKSELEDLAFKYVYPEEYRWIVEEISKRAPQREQYLQELAPIVRAELKKEGVEPLEIGWRVKGLYSLWKKLQRKEMDWGRIKDLAALRIIVKDVEACYATLGIVHKLWRPLPGRIKDYIALPKPNGYQSIHTTVFATDGKITEFQIRTPEMHRDAELGIAAHWAWELAGKPKSGHTLEHSKFAWVRQLRDWQKEFKSDADSSQEFLESLKIDFFKNRIFVLTPKGDVIDLPEGATPIDFAYHVHSDIGDAASGAKVNGKMTALSQSLSSGDVVEIIAQKNKKPSHEWLEFVKTSLARERIRATLKKTVTAAFPRQKTDTERTELTVTARDRVGLTKDILAVFEEFRISLESVRGGAADVGDHHAIAVIFTPKNKEQLEKIKMRLKKIANVENIATGKPKR
ncbi:MAG: bifunctional (p)ppGpp synthetase/guanosine-3',5'-bis(diphosphate) 3'-pyrophosphohydrolase [Candidatus Niyogibacteria bacterium]|nr:bifunctional (p)ppGpp synthetase/guanosine-3',5'-bis(diphosphate) 3'-pyrophosphohydrolase [Candidatus Niyogibacteria bacterium]